MSNSFIWTIARNLSSATTPSQSGPGRDGNEGLLHIPQSSSIAEASTSDYLVSYPEHSLGKSYPSVEKQSVYSAAPADWTKIYMSIYICIRVYIYMYKYTYEYIYIYMCLYEKK